MLLLTCATLGWADELPVAREFEVPDDPEVLLADARRHTTRGAVLLGVGAAIGTGAAFTLFYDRGEPGEVSDESDFVLGLRSAGGGVLGVGAAVTMLVGGHDLGEAGRLRQRARSADVAVLPLPGGGAGAALVGTF